MAWRIKETKEGEVLNNFGYIQRDKIVKGVEPKVLGCLLYTSPSPRD